jgi:hypothetical protein
MLFGANTKKRPGTRGVFCYQVNLLILKIVAMYQLK